MYIIKEKSEDGVKKKEMYKREKKSITKEFYFNSNHKLTQKNKKKINEVKQTIAVLVGVSRIVAIDPYRQRM